MKARNDNGRPIALFVLAIGAGCSAGGAAVPDAGGANVSDVVSGDRASVSEVVSGDRAGDVADVPPAVPAALKAQLDEAAAVWAARKPSCGTYSYVRSFSSVFGAYSRTAVEITNDIPTRRQYVLYPSIIVVDAATPTPVMEWSEYGAAIGSHDSSSYVGPFEAKTIESLLAECHTILAKDTVANMLVLTIDRGIPTTCTSRPTDCVDDCTHGIRLSEFTCGPLKSDGGVD